MQKNFSILNNKLKIPSREDCVHTPFYCEENIWKLCEYIKLTQENLLNDCYAVFISNDNKIVPFWLQKSGDPNNENYILWDYHVILIYKPSLQQAMKTTKKLESFDLNKNNISFIENTKSSFNTITKLMNDKTLPETLTNEHLSQIDKKNFEETKESNKSSSKVIKDNKIKKIDENISKSFETKNFQNEQIENKIQIIKDDSMKETLVYDFEATLPFPCEFQNYIKRVIRLEYDFDKIYCRRFRVVPAYDLLKNFASDRSRMLNRYGNYIHPPPTYPPIRTKTETNNLDDFITMSDYLNLGRVYDLNEFINLFK